MALRFRGLVKAARNFREQMLAGIPSEERADFLSAVRDILEHVDGVCRAHGARVEDLPRPSRDAVAYLRRLAATPPEQLPAPQEASGVCRRIRISHVVSNLDDYLKTLSLPERSEERRRDVHDALRRSVSTIERICREKGTTPAGLPTRSARAFAMMKWLSGQYNFDCYVEQVRLAVSPLQRASRLLWPDSSRRVQVLFSPGKHLWKVSHCAHAHSWHLGVGFLSASPRDLDELAQMVAGRSGAPPNVVARHGAFVDSRDFARVYQELELLLEGELYNPKGQVWDLEVLFEKINEEFFQGGLARPRLHWRTRPIGGVIGLYDSVRDVVAVSPVLDDPRVPEYVPAFILFHELLHKKHGVVRSGPRRMRHTPEFLDEERLFPQKEKAEKWLEEAVRYYDGRRRGE